MLRLIQNYQPISVTGIFQHVYYWITSSAEDIIYHNPHYDAEKSGEESIAIYCVHGTADRVNAFRMIADRLIDDLPANIANINLISFDHRFEGIGIDDLAAQLCDKIQARPDKSIKKIILMGHSRGCLVSALFTEWLANKIGIEVQVVFAIGGPFGGSECAMQPLSWISTSIQQMVVGSDFLIDLVSKMKESKIPYYYVAAENDFLVSVDAACIPEHKDALIVLDRHGHLSIMSSHRLVEHFRERIEGYNGKLQLSLTTVCAEISKYINEFKQKLHIWSSAGKVQVLERLDAMLKNMRDGECCDNYPHAKTIGEFINEYLQDANSNFGIKPLDALNQPLNYPFSMLQFYNSQSQSYISVLAGKYKNVQLFRKELILGNAFSVS